METVEIIVYFVIALLIGSLVLSFVIDTSTGSLQDKLRSLFNKERPSYKTVDRDNLAMEIFYIWKDCGYGSMNANYTLYAVDNQYNPTSINHSTLFNYYNKYSLCNSLRSSLNGCGYGENVEINNGTEHYFGSIKGSNLLFINCNASSKNLSISLI